MELLIFLIVLAVALTLIFLLPLVSGIGSFKYQKMEVLKKKVNSDDDDTTQEYTGYLSPEERKELEEAQNKKQSKLSQLKNISVSKENLPFKFKANIDDNNTVIRNRKTKKVVDTNPSNFDFDLDELINEEHADDLKEAQKDFEYQKAKNQQQLEELV